MRWHALKKKGMKNKVCGPSSCYVPRPNLIFPSHERSLCHVPLIQHASLVKPYFHMSECHNPSTQVHSHVSILRAHKPYFSYQLFELIPRPSGPQTLFSIPPLRAYTTPYKCPSGPRTLFFIPTFRVHGTSHRPRFILVQVSFRPTNLIFHIKFSSSC